MTRAKKRKRLARHLRRELKDKLGLKLSLPFSKLVADLLIRGFAPDMLIFKGGDNYPEFRKFYDKCVIVNLYEVGDIYDFEATWHPFIKEVFHTWNATLK